MTLLGDILSSIRRVEERGKPGTMRSLTGWIRRTALWGMSLTLLLAFSYLIPGWQSTTAVGSSLSPAPRADEAGAFVSMVDSRETQDSSRYSLATAQGAASLRVDPGGEANGVIYFYNIDGNRTTHITLEVVQAPDGWEVEIDPPLHDTQVGFGRDMITVTENLCAEPTELSSEEIEDVAEGMVCLIVPSRGYALAKKVTITIRVPESEEAGTKGDVKITAVASWLGQSGAATVGQTRDFDFTVTA